MASFHLLDNRIAIQEGMSQLQTIKTAIHEIAHAKLHAIDPDDPEQTNRPDSRTREVQAEVWPMPSASTMAGHVRVFVWLCSWVEFGPGIGRTKSLSGNYSQRGP